MVDDPIVEEVRKARQQHSAQFNFDLQAIYEDLKRQEAVSGYHVVTFPPRQRRYTRLTPKTKQPLAASTAGSVLD
jgi:hypothetical protein